jgi:hypothetical protein
MRMTASGRGCWAIEADLTAIFGKEEAYETYKR